MKTDYGDILYIQDDGENYTTFIERFRSYFYLACDNNCVDLSTYKTYNGGIPSTITSYFKDCIIVQDGMLYCFNRGGATRDLYIFVDVNGHKSPNRFGYDTFAFDWSIDNQSVVPSVYWKSSDGGMGGIGRTQNAIYEKNYFKNLK